MEWLIEILLINIDSTLWEFWIIVLMCFPFHSMCAVRIPPLSFASNFMQINFNLAMLGVSCVCVSVSMRIEQVTQQLPHIVLCILWCLSIYWMEIYYCICLVLTFDVPQQHSSCALHAISTHMLLLSWPIWLWAVCEQPNQQTNNVY